MCTTHNCLGSALNGDRPSFKHLCVPVTSVLTAARHNRCLRIQTYLITADTPSIWSQIPSSSKHFSLSIINQNTKFLAKLNVPEVAKPRWTPCTYIYFIWKSYYLEYSFDLLRKWNPFWRDERSIDQENVKLRLFVSLLYRWQSWNLNAVSTNTNTHVGRSIADNPPPTSHKSELSRRRVRGK